MAVIDTATWRGRVVDAAAGAARAFAGGLLVYDGWVGSPRRRGIGVRAYRADGRRLFRVLGREAVWDVQVDGGHAYLQGSKGLRVVNLESGRVISRSRATGTLREIVGR